MKEKIIRKETYKAGVCIDKDFLPTMPHLTDNVLIDRVELRAQGVVQINKEGDQLLFQDLRVYLKKLS